MFIRNEDIKTYVRLYPIVSTIIIIHLILFFVIRIFPNGGLLLHLLSGDNYAIANGDYYRLITPMFVHYRFEHFLFNTFSLYLFGPALEQMIGKMKFSLLYFSAGIVANVFSFLLHPLYYSHIGASGAIYGLFGAYLAIIVFKLSYMSTNDKKLILLLLFTGIIFSFFTPNVNILAHLFGFISGFFILPLLFIKKQKTIYYTPYENQTSYPRTQKKDKKTLSTAFWIVLIILVLLGILSR